MKVGLSAAVAAALFIWAVGYAAPAAGGQPPAERTVPALASAAPGSPASAAPARPAAPALGKDPAADVALEWKDSADATWEANVARWRKDLVSLADQPARRDRELAARMTLLARALFAKHPDGEGRTALHRKIVADVASLGGESSGRQYLRQLVEAMPGEVDLAAQALGAIVGRLSLEKSERPREVPEGAPWLEYASSRLIALAEAGLLPDVHPAVEHAWKVRLYLRLGERRFWDAAQALPTIRRTFGDTVWLRTQEAELYAAAGRQDDALRIFQELAQHGPADTFLSRIKALSKFTQTPPDFPRDLGLEMKWAALRTRTGGADTASLQALLDDSAAGSGVMPWEEGRRASVWVLTDRLLLAQPPAALAPLRAAQGRDADEAVDRARRSADPQALFALYRRLPWSAPVHEALVASAETWLRRGWSGLALRTFQDVLAHAESPETRAKAQVGVWLAILSETHDAAALRAAFGDVAPDAQLPWMGGRQKASTIQKRLLEGLEEPPGAGSAPAAPLAVELVRIPAVPPWDLGPFSRVSDEVLRAFPSPLGSLQASGGAALVGGPNLLAYFGDDPAHPLWWRSPRMFDRPPRRSKAEDRGREGRMAPAPAPGPYVPAIAGGRVFARWGMDYSGQYLRGLVAIDARTGRMVWSTDDNPAWAETWPVSDPTVADGRVYVLTMQEKSGPMMPISLACLDAERGTLLWHRPLGTQSLALARGEERRERPAEQVHYGNAVTVDCGAAYAVTNLGFVVRCDARDGMIEWTSTYTRGAAMSGVATIYVRQGAPPALVRGRVICMPRDYPGVFALDAATGKPVWDAPLLPAEEAAGTAGDAFIIKGAGHLMALDAASGRVRWDRMMPEGFTSRVAQATGFIYASTAKGLLRIDAASGAVAEEKPHDARGPLQAMAVRGSTLLGLSESSAAPLASAAPAESEKGQEPYVFSEKVPDTFSDAQPLDIPVREAWRLARAYPELLSPPGGAKTSGRLYVASRGVLECIEMGTEGRPLWQRFIGPGFQEALWAEGTLILAYESRLAAVSADTGQPRWQCDVPPGAAAWQVCPPYVVVVSRGADPLQDEEVALVDLATGRLLWSRAIETGQRYFRFLVAQATDGQDLHLYGEMRTPGPARGVEVVVRAADGEVTAVRPFPPGDGGPLLAVAVDGGAGYCLTGNGDMWEFAVDERSPRRQRLATLQGINPRFGFLIRTAGPWLQVQQMGFRSRVTDRQWVMLRDRPGAPLALDRGGEISGDFLLTRSDRGAVAIDLRTRKETPYELPPGANAAAFRDVIGAGRLKDRVWVATRLVTGRDAGQSGMQLDTFDAATGAHLREQVFSGPGLSIRREGEEREEGLPPAFPQVVWTPEAIYMTDARGVYALAPPAAGAAPEGTIALVSAAAGPVTINGLLEDWNEGDALPLAGPGRLGDLYLAHDSSNLYVALRYKTSGLVPRIGAGDTAGGSRMELGLRTPKEALRWTLGADAYGRAIWESPAAEPSAAKPRGAVRYDPAAGELVYEAALPLPESATPPYGDLPRLGFSVAAWDEQGAQAPATPVLTLGGAPLDRGLLPQAVQSIYLYPMTRRAVGAMAAIVDALPELPESFEYFRRSAALRTESADALLAVYDDFIRRHAAGMTVERLLAMDQAVRTRFGADPSGRLADLAARAGVPQAICKRYAVEAQACLSQWMYLEPGQQPRSIVIEVDDGMTAGPAGWDHRIAWNKPPLSGMRTVYLSPEPLPSGQWHEVRVPLVLLGMNGVPLCGLSFGQQGGPRVVWDRSAIRYDGREEVFLEDGPPEGAVSVGPWEWLDQPVKSGEKSHAGQPPPERYDVVYHWVTDFARPVTLHVKPPDGPYLAQWVYLDPKAPPKTVSLGLYDGQTWLCHAIWGAKTRHGRYMGPLPPPGQWAELHLPLAWTPLADDPIAGLAFGQDAGRAFWGRTALVAGGKEQVLADGQAPPAPAHFDRTWLPWADGYVNSAHPTTGKAGIGLGCDGAKGYFEAPHAAALEPEEMTIEAWVSSKATPWIPDTRRWIVNKNTNEEADGHYALLVNKTGVGAYLNIGGTKANQFQAWSEQDALPYGKSSHIAMTYDGKDLTVYANGKRVASTPVNRKRAAGTTPLAIGRRQDGYSYFSGMVDEVRLYRRALTDEEMLARYEADGAAPAGPAADALVAYWGFDEDAMPADPAANWEWTDQVARGGKRSHTQAPPAAYGGHVCLFRDLALGHLRYDTGRAAAVLKQQVPALGPTDEAWHLLRRMLLLEPDAEARLATMRWFLKSIPTHPRAIEALRTLLDGYRELKHADPVAEVEAAIRDLGLPDDVLFQYHRKYAGAPRAYLAAWQVVGPFPYTGDKATDPAYPPETAGVRLDAVYDGAAGKVRWQLHQAESGRIDLKALMQPSEMVSAYAVCWVRSEKAQPAVIEISSDDAGRVWLNREPVISPGTKSVLWTSYGPAIPVRLAAGWNEILAKVSNYQRDWGFQMELLDPAGTGAPEGIEVSSTPPQTP